MLEDEDASRYYALDEETRHTKKKKKIKNTTKYGFIDVLCNSVFTTSGTWYWKIIILFRFILILLYIIGFILLLFYYLSLIKLCVYETNSKFMFFGSVGGECSLC